MKITKTYPIVCPSCYGSGLMNDWMPTTTTPKIQCKACNGTGIVTVTETIEDDEFKKLREILIKIMTNLNKKFDYSLGNPIEIIDTYLKDKEYETNKKP